MSKQFQIGERVTYISNTGDHERGIVKSMGADGFVFVVYHCADEWERYAEYTAASTPVDRLVAGWIDDD